MLKRSKPGALDSTIASGYDWRLTLGLWLLLVVALVIRTQYNAATTPLFWDTDDAMRLTVVRDFLAGQNWFDHTQYRINAPFGASIHWSRFVDLPIAALVLAGTALFGAAGETVAVYVWPALLLLGLLALTSKLAVAFVGREGQLPGLVLPVLSIAIMTEFSPGRIDHHSVQTVLAIALVMAAIYARRNPLWGLVAALILSTSLAVGIETLPFTLAAFLAFGLSWVVEVQRAAALRLFGAGLIGFGIVHLVVALPPNQWFAPRCDAYSLAYAAGLAVTGLGMFALSLLPQHLSLTQRLVAGVVAGAVVAGTLVGLFPHCMNGPYEAVDPWLAANWLDRITEAKPIWQSFVAVPAYTLGVTIPPLLALAVTVFRLMRGPREGRDLWAVYALFLVLAVVALIPQVRGARLVAAMTVPAGAYAIVAARHLWLETRKPLGLAALLLAWLGFASTPVIMLANVLVQQSPALRAVHATRDDRMACRLPQQFTALAQGPALRIMTPVDLGSHMILYTPHSVIGAPYHRNESGLIDTFRFFNDPQVTAKRIAKERGIDRVVICPSMPEMAGVGVTAPDALLHAFNGEAPLPPWLVETTPPGTVLREFDVLL